MKEESVPLLLSPSLPLLLNGGSALNNMYHWCRLIINKPSSNLQLISQVTRLNCNSAATPPHALAVSTGETRARGYQMGTKDVARAKGYQGSTKRVLGGTNEVETGAREYQGGTKRHIRVLLVQYAKKCGGGERG